MPPQIAEADPITDQSTGTGQDAPSPSSEASEARSPRSPNLFERLFHIGGRGSQTETENEDADVPDDSTEEDASTEEPKESEAEAEAPKTLQLTEDELERRVQSEVDRREARRQREAQAREDPAVGQQLFVENVLATYDQATLHPLMEALPDADRAQILAAVEELPPIEGRQQVVTQALKAFEKRIRADEAKKAEDRLRKNPAFRKQVVLGDRDDDADGDPDTLTAATNGAARSAGVFDMSAAIRQAAKRGGGGGRINPFEITEEDK